MKRSGTRDGSRSSTLANAAALQQHYSIGLRLTKPKKKPAQRQTQPRGRVAIPSEPEIPMKADLANAAGFVERLANDATLLPHTIVTDDRDDTDSSLAFHQSLSLAQQLGLVPRPPSPLAKEEWAGVRDTWRARGDSECAICYEPLGKHQQVLLSCSHSFHMSCLRQFEQFAQRRQCPMCRAPYQARRVFDASFMYVHKCATAIQAAARGYLTRQRYHALRRLVCPTDPALRRRWVGDRVGEIGEAFDSMAVDRARIIDAMFNEVGDALDEQTKLLGHMETLRRVKTMGQEEWDALLQAARRDVRTVCSVCLRPALGAGRVEVALGGEGGATLTSCGHLFHHRCLKTVESYLGDGTVSCPMCRQFYVRAALLEHK